ncbi:MAG: 6,7-dimethyl-8-ribityllumazine synthase [Parachlamydiaceae bacterium]
MNEIKGKLKDEGFRFAIICSRFNELITKNLLEGALQAFEQFDVCQQQITIVWVPGAFEIPLVAKQCAMKGTYHAIVCLGAVIRGSTPHFDYVCSQVSSGIAKCSYDYDIPILFNVLTTDTVDQALERSGLKAGNKGFEGAHAAIEMASLTRLLKETKSS